MNIMKLNDITSEIGFLMLTHGAEIHRVEDTICRIASAYQMQADVFAIPSSLVVTITDETGKTFTKTRRVYYRDLNLDRVDRLNDLARKICAAKPEAEEIDQKIAEILKRPAYPDKIQLFAAALSSGAFALLFGGGSAEAICAAIIGVIVRFIVSKIEKAGGSVFLTNIIGGAVCSAMALSAQLIFKPLQGSTVTISALMLLVPGLTMTNSMRDLAAGDIVTGVMKGTEAIIIATGIAVGVILALAAFCSVTGVKL